MAQALRPDERRLSQFRKLTEVSRALTYATSLEEVLDLTVRRAAELLQAPKSVLMLSNDEGLLSVRASHGLVEGAATRFQEPLDETLIRRLEGLLAVPADRFLGVPLVVGGEVTGILAVALAAAMGPGLDEQEWLLSALADQAAVALEKTRLDQTAEFRERLIGIVSHDLKSPIAAISLATALLKNGGLDESNLKVVRRIESSALRASRMIRDLLDFTQVKLGSGIRVNPHLADLHAIVRQVVDDSELAHPGRVRLIANGVGTGTLDVDRLTQVVGNLLTNALDYSPAGSVVDVRSTGEADALAVSVHNAGAPIAADRLVEIFEPMHRATTIEGARSGRSVGLGLYIVKHIVAAHGGTVTVESSAEAGTTFTVRLRR